MTKARPCGCTYRDTGEHPIDQYEAADIAALAMFYFPRGEPQTWAKLCRAMRANTDRRRDHLHQVLHVIATPKLTPEHGPGRKGTRWHLMSQNG